jgi:hypothetical protein
MLLDLLQDGSLKSWVAAGLALAFIYILARLARADGGRQLPLPPGPKGLPIIGNLLDIPQEKPWLVYNEWADRYGRFPPSHIAFFMVNTCGQAT